MKFDRNKLAIQRTVSDSYIRSLELLDDKINGEAEVVREMVIQIITDMSYEDLSDLVSIAKMNYYDTDEHKQPIYTTKFHVVL